MSIRYIANPFQTGGHHVLGLDYARGFYTCDVDNIDAPIFVPAGSSMYSPGHQELGIQPCVVTSLIFRERE